MANAVLQRGFMRLLGVKRVSAEREVCVSEPALPIHAALTLSAIECPKFCAIANVTRDASRPERAEKGETPMRYTVLFSAASLLIAGCSILENDVERGYERNILGSNPVVFTTADIRLITQRRHPIAGNEILCAEPSPDVAKALSAALQLSGQINQASGASGGGAGDRDVGDVGRADGP